MKKIGKYRVTMLAYDEAKILKKNCGCLQITNAALKFTEVISKTVLNCLCMQLIQNVTKYIGQTNTILSSLCWYQIKI